MDVRVAAGLAVFVKLRKSLELELPFERKPMRRILIHLGLIALLAAGATSCDRAARSSGGRAAIKDNLQVGIPPGPIGGDDDVGRRAPMFKAGHWTPILVTIEGKDDLENAELVVKTVDSDDVFNTNAVSLGTVKFTAEAPSFTTVVYARPGKTDSTISVTLRSKGQDVGQPMEKSLYALESNFFLYVTLGARLPGIRLPGLDDKQFRLSEIAAFDRATELPAKWYGYDTVDLAILTTGNDEFTSGWLNDSNGARREALLEWLRRGGQLVLCVGKNETLLKNRPDLAEFLPVEFEGTATPEKVQVPWGTVVSEPLSDPQNKTALTIAKMKPKAGRGVRTLVTAKDGNVSYPFVVQSSYGLGRLTILATDPELPPFNRWKSQGVFWERLLRESGPSYVELKAANQGTIAGITDSTNDDSARQLQRHVLENFDGVPVISFGWVALFIFVYILIVGPLDYLFLKKVVKRLELTWVTFPLVVLTVSAAAYFTASELKGRVQKINKVDLIDFDLRTKTVQGTTWFSIFSPRVQNYTVSLEPAEGWGMTREQISPPLVTWLGRADAKRQSLFRRSYEYDPNGGLRRVPIQVWSTKGFQGSWYHPMDAAKPPIVADLQSAGGDITGSIVSNLPVTLESVELFYKGNVYNLDKLLPGAANKKQVTATNKTSFTDRLGPLYVGPAASLPPAMPFGRGSTYDPKSPPVLAPARKTIESILFHEAIERKGPTRTTRNAMLREFDQSWRVAEESSGEDAILYGVLPTQKTEAEIAANSPATATRLWVGALPSDKGASRPALSGSMRQDTFVRVFIPVKIK